MSKHTLGPWEIIDQYIMAADESVICQWRSYSDEAAARLIAAAPDMLKALKTIARCGSIDDDWLVPVRAAIAKAEGAS